MRHADDEQHRLLQIFGSSSENLTMEIPTDIQIWFKALNIEDRDGNMCWTFAPYGELRRSIYGVFGIYLYLYFWSPVFLWTIWWGGSNYGHLFHSPLKLLRLSVSNVVKTHLPLKIQWAHNNAGWIAVNYTN